MNGFLCTVVILCAVCALLECLLPKKAGDLGALCSLFVAVCVLGAFALSDGISFPRPSPVKYDDMSRYAFCEACKESVFRMCGEYGVAASRVDVASSDGKTVEKLTVEAAANAELAARLQKIFGCEVVFE